MIVGVLKEARAGETRVAATPTTVAALQKLGYEVVVEPGAGESASFTDEAYAAAGAKLGDPLAADVVVGVNAPTLAQRDRLMPGATLIAMLNPRLDEEIVADLAQRPITALSMDAVPRISRAQSMDVLSSMANVAGYRAVVEAAHEFGRMFTGQVTAAGKIPPARVFVVGAGVAGLAAIGAASAMGAIVRAFDVRPEVAEQVESMGAEFVKVDFEAEVSTDGYAKEMTAEQEAATAAMYDEEAREADIVITTALIPGRPAPKLITEGTIAAMRNGSVIVDMAAANGGNAALTKTDERVVTDNGVTILGYTDLAGRLAAQSLAAVRHQHRQPLQAAHARQGRRARRWTSTTSCSAASPSCATAESTWPPPPVQVSAAPQAPARRRSAPAAPAEGADEPGQAVWRRRGRGCGAVPPDAASRLSCCS